MGKTIADCLSELYDWVSGIVGNEAVETCNCVAELDRLRQRIEELEAALREIADEEQQNWSVDGYGAWTWVGDDDPATIARKALEGGSDG